MQPWHAAILAYPSCLPPRSLLFSKILLHVVLFSILLLIDDPPASSNGAGFHSLPHIGKPSIDGAGGDDQNTSDFHWSSIRYGSSSSINAFQFVMSLANSQSPDMVVLTDTFVYFITDFLRRGFAKLLTPPFQHLQPYLFTLYLYFRFIFWREKVFVILLCFNVNL